MDKIWYRNPSKSEVIGRCGGDEKKTDHAEPTNSRRLKKKRKISLRYAEQNVVKTCLNM